MIDGSGGFCSYSLDRLQSQLAGWVDQGLPRVKMKVSRAPEEDPARLDAVLKEALSHGAPTLVDIVCQPLHEARAPVSEWVA